MRLAGPQPQQVHGSPRLPVPAIPLPNGKNQRFGIIGTKAPTTDCFRIIGRPGGDLRQHVGQPGDQCFDRATVYRAGNGERSD